MNKNENLQGWERGVAFGHFFKKHLHFICFHRTGLSLKHILTKNIIDWTKNYGLSAGSSADQNEWLIEPPVSNEMNPKYFQAFS